MDGGLFIDLFWDSCKSKDDEVLKITYRKSPVECKNERISWRNYVCPIQGLIL